MITSMKNSSILKKTIHAVNSSSWSKRRSKTTLRPSKATEGKLRLSYMHFLMPLPLSCAKWRVISLPSSGKRLRKQFHFFYNCLQFITLGIWSRCIALHLNSSSFQRWRQNTESTSMTSTDISWTKPWGSTTPKTKLRPWYKRWRRRRKGWNTIGFAWNCLKPV